MKSNLKSIIFLLITVAIVITSVSFISSVKQEEETFKYSDLIELFREDLVTSFVVDGNLSVTLKALEVEKDSEGNWKFEDKDGDGEKGADEPYIIKTTVKDGKTINVIKEYIYTLQYSIQLEEIRDMARVNAEKANPTLTDYDFETPAPTPWYQLYLPYIILALVIIGVFALVIKQSGGPGKINSFSRSKAKVSVNDKNAVKFADVAGADEEKAELEEVVEFLKNPEKFVKLGGRIPRGILLVGPPGTGKTLLAKAVAGEAGVPFFSISGSDFVEMYVGVGASRVRDLFDSARKTPASIIFIDEIDAVGRHRGAGLGGGHDEREQTLNQLLVEMDGFGTNSGVIVIAATNRPDILDPALLRPGRFDRRVTVNYPDLRGREEILKVHCRNKPLEEKVDLAKIAQMTIGFTGADLANLMNESALLAAKLDKSLIGMDEIEASYMKLLMGPQKKNKIRTEKDNRLCAYHEAGHAVASYYCKNTDPIKQINIISAGSAGGVTLSVPTEDKMTQTRGEMLDSIVLALGGRVAEEIILDDISTGASSDISQATNTARKMVTRYGMSLKLGTVLYGSEHTSDEVFLGRDFSSGKNYSERTASEIDDEIRNIIADCYKRCKEILVTHIDKLHFVAEFLLKYETMDEDQFKTAMESDNPTLEQIDNIAKERKQKSEAENKLAAEKRKKEKEQEEMIRREREEEMRKALGEMKGRQQSTDATLYDDFFDNFQQFSSEDKNGNGIPDKYEFGIDTNSNFDEKSDNTTSDSKDESDFDDEIKH